MLASPPAFGTRVQTAAPPISGGTLLILHDHSTAVAADSDRDRVMIVDVPTRAVHAVALSAHDEPGRLVEDAAGRVHVALRSGGAVVTLDPVARVILARRAVCSAPRGLVYQPETDSIHVACAGGELVTLPAGGGDATRVLHLERDLRDVVLDGNRLLVSRFRSAQLLVVDAGGIKRARPARPCGAC